MISIQPYVSAIARCANPKVWKHVWQSLENKTVEQVADNCIRWGDRQLAKLHYIHERGGHRAMWWANPLGYGTMLFLTYKGYQMVWMTRKQKKAAELVASAYGQGGQWLNPVPR